MHWRAEWGFSAWIEYQGKRILFDMGFSDVWRHNADHAGIDLETADVVAFSHIHRDHTRGVLSQNAWQGILAEEGNTSDQPEALADYVQIVTDSPVESDSYWQQAELACSYNACQNRYGSSDTPGAGRDLRIIEATEDTLLVEHRNGKELENAGVVHEHIDAPPTAV